MPKKVNGCSTKLTLSRVDNQPELANVLKKNPEVEQELRFSDHSCLGHIQGVDRHLMVSTDNVYLRKKSLPARSAEKSWMCGTG